MNVKVKYPEPVSARVNETDMPNVLPVEETCPRWHMLAWIAVGFAGVLLLLWSSGRNADMSLVSPTGWWLSWLPITASVIGVPLTVKGWLR